MRYLFRRRTRRQSDLETEIQSHLAMDIRERIDRGQDPDSARAAALRDFGNVTQVKEVTRNMWGLTWLENAGQDCRFAWRALRKSPGFTLLAAGALALGIGATTAMFTVVSSILLRALPYPQPDRLVMIWERTPDGDRNVVDPYNYRAWAERSRSFESMAAYAEGPMNLLGSNDPEQVTGVNTTPDFFRVLAVSPALGRTFDRSDRSPVAVLSHGIWQRRFGASPGIIGQKISINSRHHEIIGVMPSGFAFPHRRDQIFIPFDIYRAGGRNYSVIARLKRDSTVGAAQSEMAAIAARTAEERPALNARWSAAVVPLDEQTVGQSKPLLFALFAAVGFVLLIACANVANLLLMRSAGRTREMTVRVALGAGRGRILRQLTVEGLLLTGIAALCGTLLAQAGLRLLIASLPANFPLPRLNEIELDATVLVFTIAVSVAAGVLFGLIPAWQANRLNLTRALHDSSRTVASGNRLRSALVIAEVALALVLVTGSGLMIRSFIRLYQVEPGFRPDHVLTAHMLLLPSKNPENHAAAVRDILARVRALPEVAAAGSIGILPMQGSNSGTWYYRADQPEPPDGQKPGGDVSIISPGYFQAMSIPLLKGRDFDTRDRIGAPKTAIINQTAAREFFPNEDPIGKRLKVSWNDAREVEIIGVTADIRHSGLQYKPDPCLFLAQGQQPFPFVALVVRTSGDPLRLASAVKEQIRQVDPDQGVAEIRSMEQVMSEAVARPRVQTLLAGLFSLIALALAAIGIYGVVSYAVGQRTREMGIRMALGAAPKSVFAMVLRDGSRLTAAGILIGLASASVLTRYLETLLFEVEPADPLVFTAVCGFLIAVSLAACCFPAARATRVDPATVLRQE